MKIAQNLSLEIKLYYRIAHIRDLIFSPLIKLLSMLGVKPNMLSCSGVIAMLFFVLTIKKYLIIALILMLLAIFLDLLDGPLARFQKICSDKGKFIDMFCDILVFSLFVLGLIYADLLIGLVGSILIFALIFSKIFRVIYNIQFLKSDWLFKSVAGFIPNFFIGLFYFNFLIYVLWKLDYFLLISILFSILLLIDMTTFYFRIINK